MLPFAVLGTKFPADPGSRSGSALNHISRVTNHSIVVFWRVTDEPSSRQGGLLRGKPRGKEVFRPLPELEALVGIQDQRLHQCWGLLTTRFPDGFEGRAAFCR